ncbi:MAG: glycosyltransferase family 2 protein [Deltaproteobacteria bacterium]|nr:glycosyltransferase family 2 protein [Deltaproteobacteria bacterium]
MARRSIVDVTLAVTARNEAGCIAQCLRSLLCAVDHAQRRRPVRFDVVVVLDACTDQTGAIARRFEGVRTLESSGGIVEAQRAVATTTAVVIYADADIVVEPETLLGLTDAMEADPALRVAYPPKQPLPPHRHSTMANALYVYNLRSGFQTRRPWFSGKLFAIRGWSIPTRAELGPRLAALRRDNFYDLHAGMRVDDIYLSRTIIAADGPRAILQTNTGLVWFRAPETFEGMARTYRRMRMEIERLDRLFPETRAVHRRFGVRGYDRDALRKAPASERRAWWWFRAALQLCKLRYRLERAYYHHLASAPCDPWPPVVETKVRLHHG